MEKSVALRSGILPLTATCAVLAALLLGQLAGIARAGSPSLHRGFAPAHANRAKASGVVQRCKQRNRASGTVSVGIGAGADGIFTEWQMRTDTLLSYDNKGRLYPLMATQIPSKANGGIRDGGKSVVVTLKKGLRWPNGAEITSADVRFGWQVQSDPASDPTDNCGVCSLITRIDTPSRYTAVFHTARPEPLLLDSLAHNQPAVWPPVWPKWWNHDPHAAAIAMNVDTSWTWVGSQYPTNGPYYVASATDTETVLHPMKYYSTMSCGALAQTVKIEIPPSTAALLAAAATHRLNLTTRAYTLADLPELKRHTQTYVTHLDPSYVIERLELNVDSTYQGQPNPLANTNVRLALALALDKVGLIERALPLDHREAQRAAAWSFFLNTPKFVQEGADRSITGQWDPLANHGKGAYVSSTGTGQALSDARTMLAKTPWKHGVSLDLYTTANNTIREAEEAGVASDWARIGVRVVPHFVPISVLNASYAEGGIPARGLFQVVMFADGGSNPDGYATELESMYRTRGPGSDPSSRLAFNVSGIHDSAIDGAFESAARTFNTKVRNQSFAVIQREVNQKAYWVEIYPHLDIWTDDKRVQNVTGNPEFGVPFWDSYAWKVSGR